MFRRWPFFQRLLSWTKPHAPAERGTARLRAVRLEQPARRGARAARPSSPGSWTAPPTSRRGRRWRRTSRRSPSAAGIDIRYGCRWTATRRERRPPTATRFERRDDRRRVPLPGARSSRSASPSRARRRAPGMEHPTTTPTYAPAETYAGKRMFIIGKQNSGFELATGLLPWARQIVLASPSPARLSVETKIAGRRPGALRPAVRGPRPGRRGRVLDAAIDRHRARRRRPL